VSKLPIDDLDRVLIYTENLWEELRGQKLFITGGTGFFGMWLLETFCHANDCLSLGASAVLLTRTPANFAVKAPHLAARDDLTLYQGDVRDFVFPEGDFAYVIHAGTTSSMPVEPLEMFDTIVQGTRHVLDFAATHNTRKLLFISSGAVYGSQPSDITHISEDYRGAPDPLDLNSAYGEGKRAAELLCVLMANRHGFAVKIARCFAFVGPHLPLDAHFAVGNFIRDALQGESIRIGGDGTPFRSYLYTADLAIWLWTILCRGDANRAYNVGSSAQMTIREVAEVTSTALGTGQVRVAKEPIPGQAAARYVPNVDRARTELGLEERIDLASSLKKTSLWCKYNDN
jgi:nucleoside-diphosphate-sugar epimerase